MHSIGHQVNLMEAQEVHAYCSQMLGSTTSVAPVGLHHMLFFVKFFNFLTLGEGVVRGGWEKRGVWVAQNAVFILYSVVYSSFCCLIILDLFVFNCKTSALLLTTFYNE